MNDDIGGVWRTIGGRRVFIKNGQDLSTAMKESGKFNNFKNLSSSEIKERNSDLKELDELGFYQIEKNIQEKLNQNISDYYNKFHKTAEDMKITVVQIQESIKNMEPEWANAQIKYLSDLSDEYYSNVISIGFINDNDKSFAGCASNDYDMSIIMFKNKMANKEQAIETYQKSSKRGFNAKVDEENIDKAVIYHEFAHSLTNSDNKYRKSIGNDLKKVYTEYKKQLLEIKEERDNAIAKALLTNDQKDWDMAFSIDEKYKDIFVSEYAYTDWEEFSSECFSNGKLNSNPSPYSKKVVSIIDKYYKRRK